MSNKVPIDVGSPPEEKNGSPNGCNDKTDDQQSTRLPRKERKTKAGHQVYQVKKGKYSESITPISSQKEETGKGPPRAKGTEKGKRQQSVIGLINPDISRQDRFAGKKEENKQIEAGKDDEDVHDSKDYTANAEHSSEDGSYDGKRQSSSRSRQTHAKLEIKKKNTKSVSSDESSDKNIHSTLKTGGKVEAAIELNDTHNLCESLSKETHSIQRDGKDRNKPSQDVLGNRKMRPNSKLLAERQRNKDNRRWPHATGHSNERKGFGLPPGIVSCKQEYNGSSSNDALHNTELNSYKTEDMAVVKSTATLCKATESLDISDSRVQSEQHQSETVKHKTHLPICQGKEDKEKRTAGLIIIPTPKLVEEIKECTKDSSLKTKTVPVAKHVHFSSDLTVLTNTKLSSMTLAHDETTGNENDSIEKILNGIQRKRDCLESLLSRGLQYEGAIDRALRLSFEIQNGYSQIIIRDTAYAFKHDIENSLWKSAYYNVITCFRSYFDRSDMDPQFLSVVQSCYWSFLHSVDAYLFNLISLLQQTYGFDLNYFMTSSVQNPSCSKQVKLALRSCHLILIFMGDIQRYISDIRQDKDYSQAHWRYQQAVCLAPRNGKCYNQLAVIAVLCKHKLDAVYYYVRSLESSNPIQSARDRLTGIFQEICRKAEYLKHPANLDNEFMEQQSSWADVARLPKPKVVVPEEIEQCDHIRDELWVFYRAGKSFKVMLSAGGAIVDLTPLASSQKDSGKGHTKFQLKEVNKRFLVHFLYVQSKLYTRIGFEEFTEAHQETITELQTLLKYPRASSLKQQHLIKYMAINIFSIGNLLTLQGEATDMIQGSPLDNALIFGLDFFGALIEECRLVLTKEFSENSLLVLDQYLPAARIWLIWMATNFTLVGKSSVSSMTDIWEKVAGFGNAVQTSVTQLLSLETTAVDATIVLPEDVLLAGFRPLSSAKQKEIRSTVCRDNQVLALHVLRLQSISCLLHDVALASPMPLKYDEKENGFIVDSQVNISPSPTKYARVLEIDEGSVNDETIDSDVIIEEVIEDNIGLSPQFEELKARKQALRNKLAEQEQMLHERDALLQVHSSKGRVVSENHPHYIVADTNCFIEHLGELQRIIDSNEFTVVVPIIVVTELDGLSGKVIAPNSCLQTQALQAKAQFAIEFLEDRFSQKDSCLRAITSKGTELDTIAFRNEVYSGDKGNNDDVILSCCLHYCDETMNKTSGVGEPLVIQRKVVLLTDDRNLRLKAHSRYVPTVTVPMFLRLSKIS